MPQEVPPGRGQQVPQAQAALRSPKFPEAQGQETIQETIQETNEETMQETNQEANQQAMQANQEAI